MLDLLAQSTAWLEFPSGERVFLSDGNTTLGRSPGNRVIIASDRVSRNHAAIRRNEDGACVLMDLGSSNGTFVSGQRLLRPVALQDGWVIEIGLQKMIFHTPPTLTTPSHGPEAPDVACWLLALCASVLGCPEASDELAGKTYESWTARVQGVIAKYRGRTMRSPGDGLLAFWPVQSADSRASTVAAALRSLCNVQRQNEEFRLSLHHGQVPMRPAPSGEDAPEGSEVTFTMELDRLASSVKAPILITEAARTALGNDFPTRRIGAEEMQSYRGTERFYTLGG